MATAKLTTPASFESVMTTELNALANDAGAVSGEFSTNNLLYADFELLADAGTAPTAGALIELYIALKLDGTNYEDYATGASGYGPRNGFRGGFPMRAVTTDQRIALERVPLPQCAFRVYVLNKCGQALTASGHTLKMARYSEEAV